MYVTRTCVCVCVLCFPAEIQTFGGTDSSKKGLEIISKEDSHIYSKSVNNFCPSPGFKATRDVSGTEPVSVHCLNLK